MQALRRPLLRAPWLCRLNNKRPLQRQTPAPAPAAAAPLPNRNHTKVADNVYIFRYVGHQAVFIVTPAGVIATDPISLRRPAKFYIDAIQAVTTASRPGRGRL